MLVWLSMEQDVRFSYSQSGRCGIKGGQWGAGQPKNSQFQSTMSRETDEDEKGTTRWASHAVGIPYLSLVRPIGIDYRRTLAGWIVNPIGADQTTADKRDKAAVALLTELPIDLLQRERGR